MNEIKKAPDGINYAFVDPHYVTKTCAYCGEKYKLHTNFIEYKYKGKHFCSWNCKCKYIRQKELEESKGAN